MKISVALCTYNGEKYLEEQVNSIINQSVAVNEIIVCDDKSIDKTMRILDIYSSKYPSLFKIHSNSENLNSLKNFEKAISLTTGDIIFLSDQDDIWETNKVKDYLKYFDENPKIEVLASNGFCIDENAQKSEKYAIWDIPQFLRNENINFDYYTIIAYLANIATGASMAFKKEFAKEILPFPTIKNLFHDEWIAIIASKKKAFHLLDEKYFQYRIHQNQQVGGVFYEKSSKTKKYLLGVFDLSNTNVSFSDYKERLKRFCYSFEKIQLIKNFDKNYTIFFNDDLIKIQELYDETKKQMSNQYPLQFLVLKIFDFVTNKRKLKIVSSIK